MVDIGSIYATVSKSSAKLTKSKSEDLDETKTTQSDNVTINFVFSNDVTSRNCYKSLNSSSLRSKTKCSLENLTTEVLQMKEAKENSKASTDDSYDVNSETTIPDDHCFEMAIPKLNVKDVVISNVKSIKKQSSADSTNAKSVSTLT